MGRCRLRQRPGHAVQAAGHAPDQLAAGAAPPRSWQTPRLDAVGRLEAAGASEIRLGPLDETAVAQVARDMLGGEPDEALRGGTQPGRGPAVSADRAGARAAPRNSFVTVDGGTARLAARARVCRARLVGTVAAQLARLTPPARDAVEMASVLGRSFPLDELAGLLGRPPLDLRGRGSARRSPRGCSSGRGRGPARGSGITWCARPSTPACRGPSGAACGGPRSR